MIFTTRGSYLLTQPHPLGAVPNHKRRGKMNIGKTTSHEYEYRYVRRRQPEPPRKSAHVEVDEAFRAFFARRGMEPPKVSSHVVEPSSLQED